MRHFSGTILIEFCGGLLSPCRRAEMFLAMNLFFGITTLIGVVLTVYFGVRARRLELDRKRLRYEELQAAANDLGAKINKTFTPDAMFTPGLRGATFANLLVAELKTEVPVFVGVSSWKDSEKPITSVPGHRTLETNKWFVHVPESLLSGQYSSILVVDDFAMSGDFLQLIVTTLTAAGKKTEQIMTACVVTTKVAVQNHKAPNFYWQQTADDTFYFPWGRAR